MNASTSLPFDEAHYRELRRRNIVRLLFTYIGPIVILAVFFYIQYDFLVSESRRLHLKAVAENQSNTLDLFLTERRVNISNLVDDPKLQVPPSSEAMLEYLAILKRNSDAFVDVGFFDSSGIQLAYAGPFPALEKRNYSSENWFQELRERANNYIITDIYMGFRNRPHFTIAVSRIKNGRYIVLRATLDPERIYAYIRSVEGGSEVYTSIINQDGYYQLVTPQIGTPLERAGFVPPKEPRIGSGEARQSNSKANYAYSWLREANWALIVQESAKSGQGLFAGHRLNIVLISVLIISIGLVIVAYRSKKVTQLHLESEQARAQLEHAAKLASVGELAAGIAHEINNPLAAINEEAGLVKDLLDPQFIETAGPEEIRQHLNSIQESVFRCRDITRKLLGFVRKTDIDLKKHDVHKLIDGVVDGLLGPEMAVSNIEIERNYGSDIPEILTDANQLQQVILNIINNGIDAIRAFPGRISIETEEAGDFVIIRISDTGTGMTREQLEKIFLPFYTTKEVGKGTGLGLSISYGIIKSLGGTIEVASKPGGGSTFSIFLREQ
jgi:two-component system NtrC family sensor kinase